MDCAHLYADILYADMVHADMTRADMVHADMVNNDKVVSSKCENIDMPEDLSAKYKSVHVQTEKCGGNILENLFDGFSENQVKTLLDILAVIVAKRESNSFLEKKPFIEKTFVEKPVCYKKVIFDFFFFM